MPGCLRTHVFLHCDWSHTWGMYETMLCNWMNLVFFSIMSAKIFAVSCCLARKQVRLYHLKHVKLGHY